MSLWESLIQTHFHSFTLCTRNWIFNFGLFIVKFFIQPITICLSDERDTFFGIVILSYKHFDELANLSECRADIPFGKRSSYACHSGWPVAMYKIYHFIDVRRHEHVSSTR